MKEDNDRKIKEKDNLETGYFKDGLPYARIGDNSKLIVNLEALTFTNEPPSGFMLKRFAKPLLYNYTVYNIGRKQNLPEDYTFTDMAKDYADMINSLGVGEMLLMGNAVNYPIFIDVRKKKYKSLAEDISLTKVCLNWQDKQL